MKLIYVLAQAHTGSTLTDCILGENNKVVSSGELRYLGWQLYRTINEEISMENQNVCSCGESFHKCNYWSKVLKILSDRYGIDLKKDPYSLNNAFFNYFSFENKIDQIFFLDRLKARIVRFIVEFNLMLGLEYIVERRIKDWLRNSNLLYEVMAEVKEADFVVDSSKDRRIGLLLHRMYPEKVHFIFLKRSPEGFIAAEKRWANRNKKEFKIRKSIQAYSSYQQTIKRIKSNYKLKYIEITYEEMVQDPFSFLSKVAKEFGISRDFSNQENDFLIHPNSLHLVAGNPMRYKGVQKVNNDRRWKDELTKSELNYIRKAFK